MRAAISELVAILIVGAGLEPKADPRPVVKQTRGSGRADARTARLFGNVRD